MKSKSSLIALLVLAVVAGWTSVEAFKLWRATQLVADSQQLEMKVAAKVAALRAKQVHVANVDPSAQGPGSTQK